MKSVLKSFIAGVMAAGLFFSFLMMLVVPFSALLARLEGSVQRPDVAVDPTPFFRHFGLPLSAAVFVAAFALSFRQFRNSPHGAAKAKQP